MQHLRVICRLTYYSLFDAMAKKRLVIAVSGCTGTGKTKLGIELAKAYNGEVISADSMQIYQGLDIITNTVTEDEADGIKHHCINFVSPDEQYNVIKFIDYTLPIIKNLFEQGKTPIIVGGTAYYVEALLWEYTLYDQSEITLENKISTEDLKLLDSEELTDYEKLQTLDPIHAEQLHPNDCRRISRSLEILRQHGKSHSELLNEQHDNHSDLRGKLRWDGALLFSIESDQEVLDKRLDARVDKMVELGLCAELDAYSKMVKNNESGLTSQVIGFKEFESYLLLKESTDDPSSLSKAFSEGIDKMKTITRRYSRKQTRWIRNRLEQDHLYPNYYFMRLDSTFPEKWDEIISKPVHNVVQQFLSGTLKKLPVACADPKPKKKSHRCDICDVTCIGEDSFAIHMKSRKHKRKKAYNINKPIIELKIAGKFKDTSG